jgi:hypothetical protein
VNNRPFRQSHDTGPVSPAKAFIYFPAGATWDDACNWPNIFLMTPSLFFHNPAKNPIDLFIPAQ